MLEERISDYSQKLHGGLIQARREIHEHPETAMTESRTTAKVLAYLRGAGIDARVWRDDTGVIALIKGGRPGKTVALRADLDALPVAEENDLPYKSQESGKMHACGHDINTVCVLGAGAVLNKLRGEFAGNVKLIFQPAEETVGGAKPMIEDGVLEEPHVDACAAIHAWPDIPVGTVSLNHGYAFASVDIFKIRVKGKGGHAAMPHMAVDPLLTGSQVVCSLQSIVSRHTEPLHPAVLSVTYFQAGTSYNIIPDEAVIKGTVRTYDAGVRKSMPGLMERTIKGVTEASGASYEFEYINDYPALFNDTAVTDLMKEAASKIVGARNIIDTRPTMGGEDFAYIAQLIPSAYVCLGCRNPEKGCIYPLHNSRFNADEDCILTGVKVLAQFALDYLAGSGRQL